MHKGVTPANTAPIARTLFRGGIRALGCFCRTPIAVIRTPIAVIRTPIAVIRTLFRDGIRALGCVCRTRLGARRTSAIHPAQIASLCLKSANAVILKGGREAAHSNAAIVRAFQACTAATSAPGLGSPPPTFAPGLGSLHRDP